MSLPRKGSKLKLTAAKDDAMIGGAGGGAGSARAGRPRNDHAQQQRQSKFADKSITDFKCENVKELRPLLTLMAKTICMQDNKLRKMSLDFWDTFTIESDSPVMAALDAEYTDYLAQARADPTKMGAPCQYQFPVLVATLAEMDIGAANKRELSGYVNTLSMIEAPDINEDHATDITIEKMHSSRTRRLMLAMRRCDFRKQIISSLAQLGAKHHIHAAPRGYMVDRISQYAQALDQTA